MSNENKDNGTAAEQPTTEAPKDATKETARAQPKSKTESKPKGESAGALKAVGQAACKRHNLAAAWVTGDGQAFAQENDAKNHAKNLPSKEIIKVTAK